MRVHELAKDLDVPSKELVTVLQEWGFPVKSHMSSLTDEQVEQAREIAGGGGDKPVAAPTAGDAPRAADDTVDQVPTQRPDAELVAPPEPESVAPSAEIADVSDDIPPAGDEAEPEESAEDDRVITVKGPIVVREFAEMMQMKPNQLIAELMSMNVFASINQTVEVRVAQQLATKHGYVIEQEKRQAERKPPPPKKKEPPPEPEQDQPEQLKTRPPIVTILGHVDHGKTSLLDYIRHTRVAAGEEGGITQHIGAYTVQLDQQSITFLDTPGHAAFTAMRARGANVTDIAVIVIAADDGIMPQTREAIQHAKAANVQLMVAINKIDLPSANLDRVKQQLQQEGLTVEDWGGELIAVPVSAQTGEGIDDLLEMILLQAEILELSANPTRKAQGYVVEAQLEPGRGPTCNLLVRRGTLKVGDAIICGNTWGRVKALINDRGESVTFAGPSTPVKCLGLSDVPEAGCEFEVMPDHRKAKQISDERQATQRQQTLETPTRRASLDEILNMTAPSDHIEMAVILKADVQGSVEALQHALGELPSDKITLKVLLAGVGNVSANDVLLASASNAIILGFHVAKDNEANSLAKREGVEIRLYNIIYELIDDVREVMTGMLAPEEREQMLGQAEVRVVFDLSHRSRAAGCMVVKGKINSKSRARLRRGNDVLYEGRLESLRRFQNDATEVREGQECGIRLDGFREFEVGDVVETYDIEKLAATL